MSDNGERHNDPSEHRLPVDQDYGDAGRSIVEEPTDPVANQHVSDWLDAATTRVLAGLSLSDLRGLALGEPPRRPDPRLAAHLRSFWLHLRPRYYHKASTRFTYTFRLGLLATLLLLVEVVTGVYLMIYYTPSPDQAYQDMVRIVSGVTFGQLLRDMHRLGAEALVVVVVLHLARTYLTGSYKAPRRFTWVTGVVLLIAVLFLSFSGYLLPWDQLSFWAITIGASLADSIPPVAFGHAVKTLLLGGAEVGADALLRFYLLHVLLTPVLALVFFAVHYFKVVRAGLSLPPSMEPVGSDTARRIPPAQRRYTIPDVLVDEINFTLVVILVLVAVIILRIYPGAPLGNHADPLRTPLGATAPWYFLWVQGLVKLGNPTLFGVIVPVGFFLLLLLLPYLDRNPSRRGRDRRLAIGLFCLVMLALAGLSWLGRPSHGVALPPAEAVVQQILPEEGRGPMHRLTWQNLQSGVWDTRTGEISTANPELRAVLAAIEANIQREDGRARQAGAEGLPNGRAMLLITPWQPDLKKVTLRVLWQAADGAEQVFERSVFLQRDAGPQG